MYILLSECALEDYLLFTDGFICEPSEGIIKSTVNHDEEKKFPCKNIPSIDSFRNVVSKQNKDIRSHLRMHAYQMLNNKKKCNFPQNLLILSYVG